MTSDDIRRKFLTFFEQRGHKIIPSASLVPENDPSVLFTTAGMQQFKPYYTGDKNPEADFGFQNICSAQKCVRTSDIDEVGDNTHLTFFEMLGNFSFGGYGKKEAIRYAYDFITKELELKIDYVSIFGGAEAVPADEESENIWREIDPNLTIKKFGRADNFWGPTGQEGPCGPTTEIYVQGVEIWNIVFNQYYQEPDGSLKPLARLGIDTGMGLERLTIMLQAKNSVYETDLFAPIMSEIIRQSAQPDEKIQRIVADHLRAAVFMLADGVIPSNTDRGYILRRLLRRAARFDDNLGLPTGALNGLAELVVDQYCEFYPELKTNREKILSEINKEEEKFRKTMSIGSVKLHKLLDNLQNKHNKRRDHLVSSGNIYKPIPVDDFFHYEEFTAKDAFDFYTVEGIDLETTLEYKNKYYPNLPVEKDIESKFGELFLKHQDISRTSAEQKFKGGLAGTGEMETKYHTATHLLLAALRQFLGADIVQKGSNITAERLRFDFSWPDKMTAEQLKAVEDLVNQKIAEKIPVEMLKLPKAEAKKIVTVLSFDEAKYGDTVKVFKIGDFSAEFCGGPHVANTDDLGRFKIIKEEAVAAGVRRIKAELE